MRASFITASFFLLAAVAVSCRTVVKEEWSAEAKNAYIEKALKVFNRPDYWKSIGKTRPSEFTRNTRMKTYFSSDGSPSDQGTFIKVNIPVTEAGIQGSGVPHVVVVMEHPSGRIVNLYTTQKMF